MRFSRVVSGSFVAIACSSLASCGASEDGEPIATIHQPVSPPTQAHCNIVVQGKGTKSMEDDYLPHVIQCENGGANLQALKAQAIAARSVAYYAIATSGSICDGQGCQVYGCGATPQAKHIQAVKETAGQYLTYGNMLTYGFYVAGDSNAAPPGCKDYAGTTSKYVTYNEGKTGTSVTQTSLGYIGPPGYGQNRGCMGQWGARCLENDNGYDYKKILQFYYGADIGIAQATGPCVVPSNKPPTGSLDEVGCDKIRGWGQDPDEPAKAIDVHLYFGGPAGSGSPAKSFLANLSRPDLCSALGSCEHAFDLRPPLSLFDGQPHAVHGYAIDSSGGNNAELGQSPLTLTCAATLPGGIRRHVTTPDSLAAWKLDLFWSKIPANDAAIAAIPEKDPLAQSPVLVQADDGTPEVWLMDGKWRRHVPDPTAFAAWSFATADVQQKPSAEVYAVEKGPPVRAYPVLVQATSGKVDLIDDPFPAPASGGSGGQGNGGTSGAGASGSGSGGNGGSGLGGFGAGVSNQPESTPGDVDGSCACRTTHDGTNGWPFVLLVLAPLGRARRRCRPSWA